MLLIVLIAVFVGFGAGVGAFHFAKGKARSRVASGTSFPSRTGRLNPEFLLFECRVDDRLWGVLTRENIGDYQHWFEQLELLAGLDEFFTLRSLPEEALKKMSDVADEAYRIDAIHPPILLLVGCLFVQADTMRRRLERRRWMSSVASRPNWAPAPEATAEFVMRTFFGA